MCPSRACIRGEEELELEREKGEGAFNDDDRRPSD